MAKYKKNQTAEELMRELRNDPVWVQQEKEREAKHKAAVEQLRVEVQSEHDPLLKELAQVGHPVGSVWDLVNSPNNYPAAVPILCKHLGIVRHPVIVEGIARALMVREAIGLAGKPICAQLQRPDFDPSDKVVFALAYALTAVADRSVYDEIRLLSQDTRYAPVHRELKKALKKIS